MIKFIVRHLEHDVKSRLKRRAERHGRSMEEEVRHILRNVVKAENTRVSKLGSRIAARFRKSGLRAELPELHGEHFQDLNVPVVNPWEGQDR
jgi:plasmid stability protein